MSSLTFAELPKGLKHVSCPVHVCVLFLLEVRGAK